MNELNIIIGKLEVDITYNEKYELYIPTSDGFCNFVLDWLKEQNGNWCNHKGTGLYNKIEQIERLPDVNSRVGGIYIFENEDGHVIYVGKSENGDRIFNRVLDHFMPSKEVHNSNRAQNTSEIWNEILNKNKKVRVLVYTGISSKLLCDIEHEIYQGCIELFGHKPLYNKKIPSKSTYLDIKTDNRDKEPLKVERSLIEKCGDELVGVFSEIHNNLLMLSGTSFKRTNSYICYYINGVRFCTINPFKSKVEVYLDMEDNALIDPECRALYYTPDERKLKAKGRSSYCIVIERAKENINYLMVLINQSYNINSL